MIEILHRRILLILVLDFGGQYAQLIARRVGECRVYSEMVPYDTPVEEIRAKNPEGIILSGGPNSVYEEGAPRVEPDLFELSVPLLGICYGMQLMALVEGGEVGAVQIREYGRSDLVVKSHEGLFAGTPDEQKAWMSHGDAVFSLPEGFEITAETPSVPIIAFEDREQGRFGVQFHPEVRHTEYGMEILKNFLYEGLRLPARVDAGQHHYRRGREDKRTGRRGKGHLRTLRRGRFCDGGDARPQGHR